MGVSASLKAIHTDDLARISADSNLVVPFLFGTPTVASLQPKRSFLDRLLGESGHDAVQPFHETPTVTFGGHWELMTFALSGPNPPTDNSLDLVESDFESCTPFDLGYGPPRLIPEARMLLFNDEISDLSDEDIVGRLNEAELTEAEIFERDQILAELSEWKVALIEKATELREFARYCTEHHCAALVYFH